MTKGTDNYPKTIVERMRILNDCKVPSRLQRTPQADGEGMAFVQEGGRGGRGGSQSDGGNQLCWHCEKTGHLRKKCPELQQLEIGVDNLNIEDYDNAHALFSTKSRMPKGRMRPSATQCQESTRDPSSGSPIHQHLCKLPQHSIPRDPEQH
jgi:hypothetical protein